VRWPIRLLNAAPRDAVSELLAGLTVRSSVYCLSDLGAPWGFQVDADDIAKFHLVLEGRCWLRVGGLEPVPLGPGELVILPRGQRHVMSDSLDSPVIWLDQLIADHPLDANARLHYGDGVPTRLLCGGFALAGPVPASLLTLLPPVLTMSPGPATVSSWIEPVFALVRDEAKQAAPGAQVIFAKLADVFLTQALRSYLAGAGQAGLLDAQVQRDPLVEAAVKLIHDQPAQPWTLAGLAREIGLSRTALATRFRAATGETPMHYLAKVRLGQAAGYLATSELSVEAIARRTGYANNAALSKAFNREFGVPPGAYRKNRAGDANPATPRVVDILAAPGW
jgi:AraC-like DNA-binding protein